MGFPLFKAIKGNKLQATSNRQASCRQQAVGNKQQVGKPREKRCERQETREKLSESGFAGLKDEQDVNNRQYETTIDEMNHLLSPFFTNHEL
jgi:hypothetical protein